MILYPQIDPIAMKIGKLSIHWYGLLYLLSFLLGWYALKKREKEHNFIKKEQIGDLVSYAAMGVLFGGRLGYVVFYNPSFFWLHPLSIFTVWEGGMSFHGGFIGVCIAVILFAYRYQLSAFEVGDFLIPVVPIGLGLGRIGNFINGELWGRATSVSWGVIFPQAGPYPRHLSILYEFLLEGPILFSIIWCFSRKKRARFLVSAVFLVCYGSFRFFCEFFRSPDPQLGFIAGGWLTMGQLLCLPMVVVGGGFLVYFFWQHYQR